MAMISSCRLRIASSVAAVRHLPASIFSVVQAPRRALSIRPNAAAADGPAPSVQERLKVDMKAAMKAKDQERLTAIRFLSAAIQTREIELREKGGVINGDEVIKVIQKLAKQRQDSIESYKAGGREDLVQKEEQELELLRSYLPAMMSQEDLQAVVDAVVAEVGATGVKQMGAVMKGVQTRTAGRADNKMISELVKAKLQG